MNATSVGHQVNDSGTLLYSCGAISGHALPPPSYENAQRQIQAELAAGVDALRLSAKAPSAAGSSVGNSVLMDGNTRASGAGDGDFYRKNTVDNAFHCAMNNERSSDYSFVSCYRFYNFSTF